MMLGHNLRTIMLQSNSETIQKMLIKKTEVEYFPVDSSESWKVNLLKEIINVKHDELSIASIEGDELEELLVYICTS